MGLTLGLGLALFGCEPEVETESESSNATWEADAVTYAGPDSWGTESAGNGDTTTDASSGDFETGATYGTTAATEGSSDGSGSGSDSGSTTGTDSGSDDEIEADAVTYAGPDPWGTTGGSSG